MHLHVAEEDIRMVIYHCNVRRTNILSDMCEGAACCTHRTNELAEAMLVDFFLKEKKPFRARTLRAGTPRKHSPFIRT